MGSEIWRAIFLQLEWGSRHFVTPLAFFEDFIFLRRQNPAGRSVSGWLGAPEGGQAMRKPLFLQRFGARGDSMGHSGQPGGGPETLRPAAFRDFLKAPPQKLDRFSPPSAETNLVIFL